MDRIRGVRFTQRDVLVILWVVVMTCMSMIGIVISSLFIIFMMNNHTHVNEKFSNDAVCIANDFNYFAQKFEPMCACLAKNRAVHIEKNVYTPKNITSEISTNDVHTGSSVGTFFGNIISSPMMWAILVPLVCNLLRSAFKTARRVTLIDKPPGSRPNVPIDKIPAPEHCCAICQELPKDVVYMPCRHLSTCQWCARDHMKTSSCCPVCRAPIENIIKVYT